MVTATELAYLVLLAETTGLRAACQAVQPKTLGKPGSPAYRRLIRDMAAAERRCADAWSRLSPHQRDAVRAAARRIDAPSDETTTREAP